MAAREIKTTLALDGEKQFKAGMDDAYRAMKVLGSEMKVNTAEFGKNAQSMDGLVGKQKNLASMQEQQKKIVEALNKAVEESAQAYGESDKRTDAYRIKLNNAKASLVGIESQLEQTNTDIENFGNETTKAEKKTIDWKGKLGELDQQLDKGIGVMTKVVAGIAAFGAAAIATGKQMFDLTAETGKWADKLITTSIQTGISTTALQEWGYAAQFIDTEVETMTGSMARMIRQLALAKEGTGQGAEAFAALGVSITDSSGQLLNSQDIFFAAIDALGKVANETERDALAMQIFGRSAQELNPLIQAGASELQRLGAEAQSMGIVMGEDNVRQLGAFDDKMNVFNSTIGGIKNSIAVALTPAMEKIIEVVQKVAAKFGEWVNSPAAQTLIGALTDKIINLADNIGNNLDSTLRTVIGAFETVSSVIGWVIDNAGLLKNIVIALTSTLVALKTAQLAVNIAMAANPIGLVVLAIAGLVTAIVLLISNWDAVKTAVVRVWESIKASFNAGVAAVKGFIDNIIGFFGNLITSAFDAGKNLVSGLWKGIQSAAAWLWENISGWIGGVWKDIKGFFGIASPSKLMADTIGKPMVQGMALGITKNAGLIDAAMNSLMPSVVNSSVTMDVTRRFTDVTNSRASGHGSLVSALREALGDQTIVLNDREFGRAVRKVVMA
ncbi:MAG: hypothetical protein PHX74_11720 [Candidatus Sumerlaeales bacterium]|nr:hypothetical protein [Candidatus Sumerlaeales bacterium]